MRLPRRAPLLLALSLLTSADSPRRVRVGVAQLISETHAPSYTERIRMCEAGCLADAVDARGPKPQ